jgi:hypothetical protein
VLVATTVLVALAVLVNPGGDASRAQPSGPGPAAAPLTWTARSHVWQLGCQHTYLIDRPAREVPPPPAEQDAAVWAEPLGAVHGGETLLRVTVQGRTSSAVVLEALRVRVVERAAPADGNAFRMSSMGCGGGVTPRSFEVDLDADRPVVHSRRGNEYGQVIPPVTFPYRVSADDPEVFLVRGHTAGCDCRWYLELEWSSRGRSGTVRIDDHGLPFRTSGIDGPQRYEFGEAAWRRVRDES